MIEPDFPGQKLRGILLVLAGVVVTLVLGVAFGASAISTADLRWTFGWLLAHAVVIAALVWLAGVPSAGWAAVFGLVMGVALVAIGHVHLYVVSNAAPEGAGFFSHLSAYAEAGVEYTRRLRWGQLIEITKGPNQIWFGWLFQLFVLPLFGAAGGVFGAGYVSEERAISSAMKPFRPIDTAAVSSIVLDNRAKWVLPGLICLAASLWESFAFSLVVGLVAPYLYAATAARVLGARCSPWCSLRGWFLFLLVSFGFSCLVSFPSMLLFGLSAAIARAAGLAAAAIGVGLAALLFLPLFHRLWLTIPISVLRGCRRESPVFDDIRYCFATAWHEQRAPGSFISMTLPALLALVPQQMGFIAIGGGPWYTIPLAVAGAFYLAPLGFVVMMERGLCAIERTGGSDGGSTNIGCDAQRFPTRGATGIPFAKRSRTLS